jgi:hypothetical protein
MDYKFIIILTILLGLILLIVREMNNIKTVINSSYKTSRSLIYALSEEIKQKMQSGFTSCVDKIKIINGDYMIQIRKMNEFGKDKIITTNSNDYIDSDTSIKSGQKIIYLSEDINENKLKKNIFENKEHFNIIYSNLNTENKSNLKNSSNRKSDNLENTNNKKNNEENLIKNNNNENIVNTKNADKDSESVNSIENVDIIENSTNSNSTNNTDDSNDSNDSNDTDNLNDTENIDNSNSNDSNNINNINKTNDNNDNNDNNNNNDDDNDDIKNNDTTSISNNSTNSTNDTKSIVTTDIILTLDTFQSIDNYNKKFLEKVAKNFGIPITYKDEKNVRKNLIKNELYDKIKEKLLKNNK